MRRHVVYRVSQSETKSTEIIREDSELGRLSQPDVHGLVRVRQLQKNESEGESAMGLGGRQCVGDEAGNVILIAERWKDWVTMEHDCGEMTTNGGLENSEV
jgi:hypothetical protein